MLQVIVDLDGTLSDSTHRQHYMRQEKKDWKRFYEELVNDPPNHDILYLVNVLYNTGNKIILASGRPEEWKLHTVDWLIRYDVPYNALYMRKTGDYRPDYVIKLELLEQMRQDGYNPNLAFDDRDQVVKAWRDAGIRCLQVAEGNF